MGIESKDKEDAIKNPASCTIGASTHLLAAGSAAAVSAIAVQPLDVLKTRLQTNVALRQNIFANISHIFRLEGTRGLYRGLAPTLGSVVPSISIYFTLYNSIKATLGCPSGDQMRDVVTQSAAAGLASSATAAITNPLWLIKTRLQTQPVLKSQANSHNTFQTFKAIIREDGVRGLYKGLGASFLASSQAMVQFPIYEELKLLMCSSQHTLQKKTCSYLAASAISASLACILTYPAEVVRARLQVQGSSTHKYDGIMHAFRKIWAQEGATGLYRGLLTSLIKMTPAHAISFTTYEFMLRFLTASRDWKLSDLDATDLPKNENIQFTFRPYLPPKFGFIRFPFSSRYTPRSNPYSFSPSFSHILATSYAESYKFQDKAIPEETGKRWSEYFW